MPGHTVLETLRKIMIFGIGQIESKQVNRNCPIDVYWKSAAALERARTTDIIRTRSQKCCFRSAKLGGRQHLGIVEIKSRPLVADLIGSHSIGAAALRRQIGCKRTRGGG